jgi:hypothetical protein
MKIYLMYFSDISSLQFHRYDQNWMCQVEFTITSPQLADFWPFQEISLVECAPHKIIDIKF